MHVKVKALHHCIAGRRAAGTGARRSAEQQFGGRVPLGRIGRRVDVPEARRVHRGAHHDVALAVGQARLGKLAAFVYRERGAEAAERNLGIEVDPRVRVTLEFLGGPKVTAQFEVRGPTAM